jgi:hypothetical protein
MIPVRWRTSRQCVALRRTATYSRSVRERLAEGVRVVAMVDPVIVAEAKRNRSPISRPPSIGNQDGYTSVLASPESRGAMKFVRSIPDHPAIARRAPGVFSGLAVSVFGWFPRSSSRIAFEGPSDPHQSPIWIKSRGRVTLAPWHRACPRESSVPDRVQENERTSLRAPNAGSKPSWLAIRAHPRDRWREDAASQ